MKEVNKYLETLGDPIAHLSMYMQKAGYLNDQTAYIKEICDKTKTDCLSNLKGFDQIRMPNYNVMFDGIHKEEFS